MKDNWPFLENFKPIVKSQKLKKSEKSEHHVSELWWENSSKKRTADNAKNDEDSTH